MRPSRTPVPRLLFSILVAVALVATAVNATSSGTGGGVRPVDLQGLYNASKNAAAERANKNAISRAGDLGSATQDPTTAAERRANAAYVARSRNTRTRS